MADKKSKQNPHQWPNGSWHSISWADHLASAEAAGQSVVSQLPSVTTQHVPASDPATWAINQPQFAPQSTPSAQPVDPLLENTRLVANRNVAVSRGNAAYETDNLGFDLGYNLDGTINTANPYSRAALLQLSHEQQRAGTTTSYAAQGQQYSGAYNRAQAGVDRNYAIGEAANRVGYQRGLHGIQSGLLGTFANAGTGVSDADFAALLKATYPGS